jgi:amino acid adenylation domain-containing protein
MSHGKCLHELIEETTVRYPKHVAVSTPAASITYRELEANAAQVARALRAAGAGPNVLIGLCIDRSIEMIVGLLAILKAGAAYVPIDPAYPQKRIEFIASDSGIKALVTVTRLKERLGPMNLNVKTLCVDEDESRLPPAAEREPVPASPSDAAYVIYTSGSTGVPKGVVVEHRNVTRLFVQLEPWFRFSASDVWTMFHSISFDFSVWEIFGALLYGGRLVIVPYKVSRSPESFHQLVRNEAVTILSQTPSAFRQLIAVDARFAAPFAFALRHIVFGGEALDLGMLEPWIKRYGDKKPQLVNMYGITETTIHVTYRVIRSQDLDHREQSPIGVPIPDLEVHLLDESRAPVPDGQMGEIYVSGPGVAKCYLGRPDLTKQRFIPMPGGRRMYRSGDLAVRTSSGDLIYKGRADAQMKISGFRLEPKEIESCLTRHPGVTAAVVLPHDYGEGDVRLWAYLLPVDIDNAREGDASLVASVRAVAALELPLYSRPSEYFLVSEIPLTEHGKIDRERIHEKVIGDATACSDAEDMHSIEREIAEICESILLRSGIGLRDDLFDIGATSLAVVRILAQINERFNVHLLGSELGEEATVRRLAACVMAQSIKSNHEKMEHENGDASSSSAIFA